MNKPLFVTGMPNADMMLFAELPVRAVHAAAVRLTDDGRVRLSVHRPGAPEKELFSVGLDPETAKRIGYHLDRAAWRLDRSPVGCACGMCVERPAPGPLVEGTSDLL